MPPRRQPHPRRRRQRAALRALLRGRSSPCPCLRNGDGSGRPRPTGEGAAAAGMASAAAPADFSIVRREGLVLMNATTKRARPPGVKRKWRARPPDSVKRKWVCDGVRPRSDPARPPCYHPRRQMSHRTCVVVLLAGLLSVPGSGPWGPMLTGLGIRSPQSGTLLETGRPVVGPTLIREAPRRNRP